LFEDTDVDDDYYGMICYCCSNHSNRK